MNFLIKKWLEKLLKSALTALVAVLLGPRVLPILQPVFDAAGWTLTPETVQAALWVVFTALVNYLKHQGWVPVRVRTLL